MRGLTMEELSNAMHGLVTKQAISKYEKGLMRPASQVLQELSRVLDLPPHYFQRQGVRISEISFRDNGEPVPTRAERQMILVAQDKMERYLQIEELLGKAYTYRNPLNDLTISTMEDVEEAALKLRSFWGLGSYPILSVYEMLEGHNIKVIEFAAGENCALGFSTYVNQTIPLIVVNSSNNHTSERKRFTALHELAHLMLTFDEKLTRKERERFCHRFAGAFLCTKLIFFEDLGIRRTAFSLSELISLRCRYGISIAAIVHRAKDLGIISDNYYNHIYDTYIHVNIMETGWGEYPISERTDRFERLLHRAIAEKFITEEEAKELGEWNVIQQEEHLVIL